ncbi:hypothetical protein C1H46_024099 [Malus baccata]|uniref:Uncharacterized protein n=1 Tax=Malus baccata TaxID=106549 RepID=A0A540LVM8_MALBA|nr:hypothetical protein C1H46_024099 [Malus baccata]
MIQSLSRRPPQQAPLSADPPIPEKEALPFAEALNSRDLEFVSNEPERRGGREGGDCGGFRGWVRREEGDCGGQCACYGLESDGTRISSENSTKNRESKSGAKMRGKVERLG